jgi:hypothetical protein
MDFLRKVWSGLFAITSAVAIWGTFRIAPHMLHRQFSGTNVLASIEAVTVCPIEAIVFGLAWWSVWKEKPSARFWGVAASLIWLLTALIAYVQFSRLTWALPIAGIAGLIAFSAPDKTVDRQIG